MRNQPLHEKYYSGAHWLHHPLEYADRFSTTLSPKSLVADIGCSQGRDVRFFEGRGHTPVGVDISLPNLQQARPSVVAADAHFLPFPEATFDGLYMINVIHYLLNPEAAMQEAYFSLVRGGVMQVHVNKEIVDTEGNIDLTTSEEEIKTLVRDFQVESAHEFQRDDTEPTPHTHKIIELVLRK